jgi:hypothetical protein
MVYFVCPEQKHTQRITGSKCEAPSELPYAFLQEEAERFCHLLLNDFEKP